MNSAQPLIPSDIINRRLEGFPLAAGTWARWFEGLQSGKVEAYHHAALLASLAKTPLSLQEAEEVRTLSDSPKAPANFAAVKGSGTPSLAGAWSAPQSPTEATVQKAIKGEALEAAEIKAFAEGVASLAITDAQVAAFAAGVYMQGMAPPQVAALTQAMTFSGSVLDMGDLPGPIVDKHSTGGVGDKVSLPLAAVLAAGGCFVPMVSGRGLGHTGGTLDKLQSIPGFRMDLPPEVIADVVREVGCCIVGQTSDLAPADKRIYAIRDVTGTVSSIPLITASILSKKLAEDLDALFMDVKVGSGAFIPELDGARALAKSLTQVGKAIAKILPVKPGRHPLRVGALLTAMDRPLGKMIGHTLEVRESVDCLRGEGPEDLHKIVVAQAGRIFVMSGIAPSVAEGEGLAEGLIRDGQAMMRFRRMVSAQGGDVAALDTPAAMGKAPVTMKVKATKTGNILKMDALTLGRAVVALGGGRRSAEDHIDLKVGLELRRQVGEPVEAGDEILTIHAPDKARAEEAHEAIQGGLLIGPGDFGGLPLLIEECT